MNQFSPNPLFQLFRMFNILFDTDDRTEKTLLAFILNLMIQLEERNFNYVCRQEDSFLMIG